MTDQLTEHFVVSTVVVTTNCIPSGQYVVWNRQGDPLHKLFGVTISVRRRLPAYHCSRAGGR